MKLYVLRTGTGEYLKELHVHTKHLEEARLFHEDEAQDWVNSYDNYEAIPCVLNLASDVPSMFRDMDSVVFRVTDGGEHLYGCGRVSDKVIDLVPLTDD